MKCLGCGKEGAVDECAWCQAPLCETCREYVDNLPSCPDAQEKICEARARGGDAT